MRKPPVTISMQRDGSYRVEDEAPKRPLRLSPAVQVLVPPAVRPRFAEAFVRALGDVATISTMVKQMKPTLGRLGGIGLAAAVGLAAIESGMVALPKRRRRLVLRRIAR